MPSLPSTLTPLAPGRLILVGVSCAMVVAPLISPGVSVLVKCTYTVCAGVSLYGVRKFWRQKVGLTPHSQQVYNRAMAVMLLSGAVHICLALGGFQVLATHAGLPPPDILDHIVDPEICLFSMINLVLHPLVLLNLGYLAGCKPRHIAHPIGFNLMGNSAMILSSLDVLSGVGRLFCTGVAITLFFVATSISMRGLEDMARRLTFANSNRVEVTIDATKFCWSLVALVQTLNLMNVIGIEPARVLFALLDCLTKFAVLHLMLKSRPAVEAASDHFRQLSQHTTTQGSRGFPGKAD